MAQALNPEYEIAEGLKEEALLCVDQALLLEESKNIPQAVMMYQKALSKLEKAMEEYNSFGDEPVKKKNKLRLSSIRQQVLFRLQEHQPGVLQTSSSANSSDAELPSDAEILFLIPGEVQIFYISASGQVSCPSYPSSLQVFRFKEFDSVQPAFLKVGTWVYPLIPGQSPVLKSNVGKYMFPDLDNSMEGNAIGLIFPDNMPKDDLEVFEVILEQLTAAVQRTANVSQTANQEMESYDEYMQFSTKLSSGMVKGAEIVGLGLVAASVKASELLHKGTEKLKESIEPGTEEVQVDPRVKTGLEVARWTASKAASGTGFLVSKAGIATLALGRFIAPHIRQGGAMALSHFTEQSDEKSQKQMEIAGEVAGGTVRAFSSIYMSLENSSKILLQNMANNTVSIVSHRYGNEAGSVTENALSTAGNAYLTVYNAAALGPKGLAKRVAKNTGKVLVNADPETHPELGDEKSLQKPRKGSDSK